ncbi:MAG: BlaI/MecI/CopY family transcriptional regulator [Gemmatimonadaceae bacterium]
MTPLRKSNPRALPAPTDGELRILQVLWAEGPSTVRDVHDVLGGDSASVYTTTLKLLQLMAEKGLVTVDKSARQHVFAAVQAAATIERQMTQSLMRKVFGGSTSALVLRALEVERTTPEELQQIRDLLDRLDRDGGAKS